MDWKNMFSLRNILKKFKKDKNEEQEITQQDGYEILEVTQLSVFKNIQIGLGPDIYSQLCDRKASGNFQG
jgi:hypothetical protein